MRLLSNGAGVQSTTLILMSAEGLLPKVDGAIFADTGWEPKRVYDHLAELRKVLDAAGIPLHVVSNGNLRSDAIDPEHRYASIPYFVRNAPFMAEEEVATWQPCDHGSRPVDDCEAGCDLLGGVTVMETRTRPATLAEREGQGRRQCTSEYKLAPINRKVRELLGAAAPDFKRVPKGRVAEQWIGFSTDEIHRVSDKGGVSYVRKRYPLLELGMSRKDCERWLTSRGWGSVAKSACVGCPFHGNRQWRDLRDNHPGEWADAVEFDEAIRKGGARGLPLGGEAFLHRSRVPLSIAPIDHVTRAERGDLMPATAGLFDESEDGDPDGCSPYGCRSGGAIQEGD